MTKVLLYTLIIIISSSCSRMIDIDKTQALPITPLSPTNANKKQRILNYLQHLSEVDSTIVGQELGDIGSPYYSYNYIDFLTTQYGKTPGLLGMALGYDDYSRDYTSDIEYIKQFTDNGGLVTLNFSPPHPRSSKDSQDMTPFDYNDLIKEGTLENIHLKAILNNTANVLQILKDKNIIVLWRPFHEVNGGWFWWSKNSKKWASPQEFINLWKYVYNYFVDERKLDNLIWVYCANYQYNNDLKDVLYYYPGNECVDVVGLDYYNDNLNEINLNSSFDKLKQLNKPMAVAEIGPNFVVDGSFDNETYLGLLPKKIAYFMAWSSWPNNMKSLKDCKNANSLLSHPLVLTRDKIRY